MTKREKGTWKDKPDWHAYVYPKNLKLFKESKLVVKVLSRNSSFPFDTAGKYYFVGSGNGPLYGVMLGSKATVSYGYLMCLLNSSFIDYLVHKKSTRFQGGHFSYAKRFIEWLPIKVTSNNNERQLISRAEELVTEILSLSENRVSFLNTWLNWSNKMQNSERTLLDILRNDLDSIRTNNSSSEIWFSKVTFYHDKNPEIWKKNYHDFKIYGDVKSLTIDIYGLYEAGDERIFSIEFDDENLLEHIYLSILSLLESKLHVNTLRQLFEKTKISVIQPNVKTNTPNIIKMTLSSLQKHYSKSSINSIVEIDTRIEEYGERIDAIVYKLYDLSENEIDTTMKWLPIRRKYQQEVIQHFKSLI